MKVNGSGVSSVIAIKVRGSSVDAVLATYAHLVHFIDQFCKSGKYLLTEKIFVDW